MKIDLLQHEREMRALGNTRRLNILRYLKIHKEACILDLADELQTTFQTASKHVLRLFDVGILVRTQTGKEMRYRLAKHLSKPVQSLVGLL